MSMFSILSIGLAFLKYNFIQTFSDTWLVGDSCSKEKHECTMTDVFI
jgi:hypothetical protein